ncbi:MAG: serine/threonine-protein phosphatase, partial [Gammaproteobacteria bacterium]|nr:serine/threonine-protein phosphatase [Gammaproteobacteria bacterium]
MDERWIDLHERATAGTVVPAAALERLAMTVREMVGPVGAALAVPHGDTDMDVLGLIDHEGGVVMKACGLSDAGTDNTLRLGMPLPPQLAPVQFDGARATGPAGAVQALSAYRFACSLPLLFDGEATRYLLLLAKETALQPPASSDVLLLNLVAANLQRAVDRVRLADAEAWIRGEIDAIGKLQNLLRPEGFEHVRGMDFAVHSSPFRLVGGDYYDVAIVSGLADSRFTTEHGDIVSMSIADIAGHGPSAAVEAAMLDTVFRTYRSSVQRQQGGRTDAVATYANQHMFTRRPRASFVTAFMSVYVPDRGVLEHVCAGHPPPLLLRAGAAAPEPLAVRQEIPLGVLRDHQFSGSQTEVEAGDMLISFTDGVIERRARDSTPFGQAR